MYEWILGLPDSVTTNGRNMATYVYDSDGQKTSETRYGASYATYAYYSNGTMYWYRDANSRLTAAYNWKRGTPQKIKRPDYKFIYQYVDNNGWLTSTINARNYTTNYSRDNMGRLTVYDPPIQSSTNISYSFGTSPTQTVTRGGRVETITYDTMFRPTLTNIGGQIYAKTTYNGAGQPTFTSFPSASSNPTNGTNFTYDALGRTKTVTTAAGTTTHNYYSSHRHRVDRPIW